MSDDLSKRGGQDRERIDVNQDSALHDSAKKFGVSKQELKQAVYQVGDGADAVRQHLGKERDRSARERIDRPRKSTQKGVGAALDQLRLTDPLTWQAASPEAANFSQGAPRAQFQTIRRAGLP